MVFLDDSKPPLESLSHHGVKGMKWGVHRNRTEATTLSKADRKQAKKNISALGKTSFESKYGNDFVERKITQEQYNKLSTKAVTVRKGTEIARVTKRKDEQLQDMTYVSYKAGDKNLYRAIMPLVSSRLPLMIAGRKTYGATYEATFKNLTTLKSPSEKERIDAFTELFDSPEIKLRNGKMVTGRQFMKSAYPREVKTLNTQQLGLRFYNNFTENQFAKTPINTAYFKKIQDRGYNAIVDDNDRKHLSDTPLIILNPNGTLKKMSVKALTADDINKAQLKLGKDGGG